MPPLVSIVLPVKNGLPHIRAAVDAVRRQTYQRFELIVQDGGSTDGTLEYLDSLPQSPGLAVASAPDSGVGQAYSRGLKRSSGDLVCFAAADETLEGDALERMVAACAAHPDAVFVNGAVRMVDASGRPFEVFRPGHFELLRHLQCEVVLAFAGLVNRRVAGDALYYDESLKTCPDYDFWIRMGGRFAPEQFVAVDTVFKTARADRASMSFRAESFVQFCRDKTFILNRYLDSLPATPVSAALRRTATAGIYLWAAESILALEGPSPAFVRWCAAAARFDPWSPRLGALSVRTAAFTLDDEGVVVPAPSRQPDRPVEPCSRIEGGLALDRTFALPQWRDAAVDTGPPCRVRTGRDPWSYAGEIPFTLTNALQDGFWYWARLEIRVLIGQIGIAPIVGNDLLDEQTSSPEGPTTVFLKITDPRTTGIMIRNSGLPGPSAVDVLSASIERCAKGV